MRNIFLLFFLVILIPTGIAYPNREMPAVFQEGCPNAVMGKDLVFQDDGNGVYLRYNNSSISCFINTTEGERLWGIVQEKRVLEAQNQTEKALSKQDLQTKYTNQINNLNTVVNNSNYIQAKTNWTNADIVPYMKVLAWNDEVQAKGQIIILKILRWMLW